jgi:cell division protein ZapA
MSNVTLQIGGRSFVVACANGEEQHVAGLGRMIDGKVAGMADATQSESRMLLFAALLLADDLHEAGRRQPETPVPAAPQFDVQQLEALAVRLENLAARLEA